MANALTPIDKTRERSPEIKKERKGKEREGKGMD
jgi:hypothetical protein